MSDDDKKGDEPGRVFYLPGAAAATDQMDRAHLERTPEEFCADLLKTTERSGNVHAIIAVAMSDRGLTFHSSTGNIERAVTLMGAGQQYVKDLYMSLQSNIAMSWMQRIAQSAQQEPANDEPEKSNVVDLRPMDVAVEFEDEEFDAEILAALDALDEATEAVDDLDFDVGDPEPPEPPSNDLPPINPAA